MAAVTARGVLLERYFERRALSSISSTPFFKLASVQFGAGFLDGSTPPMVTEIPLTATKADITNVYTDPSPVLTYDASTHQISIRCEIPANAPGIPSNGANVNVAAVLDETGEAVAMLAGQPAVVNSSRGYVVTAVLETNLN